MNERADSPPIDTSEVLRQQAEADLQAAAIARSHRLDCSCWYCLCTYAGSQAKSQQRMEQRREVLD